MNIKNMSFSYGIDDVFEDVNLFINKGEKVGIVGLNGAGKTTLFKLFLNEIEPSKGKIVLSNDERVLYLPQILPKEIIESNITVYDFIYNARPIEKLNDELQKIYEEISNTSDSNKQNELFNKVDKLQRKLEYWEYDKSDTEFLKILYGMNINDEVLNKKINELSGGWKSKIAFARLLFSKPEIMLLDEPTNHLDNETRLFIIEYLKNYKGSVFVISHDISFLNEFINKILYVDKNKKNMFLYNGNYNDFKKQYAEEEKAYEREVIKQEKEIKELENFITKYSSSSGKRKRVVLDREKKLEKILNNKLESKKENKETKFTININRESTRIPIKVENLYFKYDKNTKKNIINDLSFEIIRGEKFLIVGENGIGKSTLLKLIIGKLVPDKGSIFIGDKTDIGYYAQEHELLDLDKTIMDNFKDIFISENNLRGVLGRFLFFGNDVFKKVGVLSPGERSRVALAKISLLGANVLILDEPTNHLDPETMKIIANEFKDYKGTMLVVSHNPEFVDNLGIKRTLNMETGRVDYYDVDIVKYFEKMNNK